MFTIRLAQLLAGDQKIDAQIANRLGTMHYLMNRYHPEQYEQFLKYLERIGSSSEIEKALRDYLKQQPQQPVKTMLGVKVEKLKNRERVRANDAHGKYVVKLVLDDQSEIPLRFEHAASKVLYIIMLAFAHNNLSWNAEYIKKEEKENKKNKKNKENKENKDEGDICKVYVKRLVDTLMDQEKKVNLAKDIINRWHGYNHPAFIRTAIGNALGERREELLPVFMPHNTGRTFVFPLQPSAISIPREINSIVLEWHHSIEKHQMHDFDQIQHFNDFINDIHFEAGNAQFIGMGMRYRKPRIGRAHNYTDTINDIRHYLDTTDPVVMNALAELYDHRMAEAERPTSLDPDVMSRNSAREAFELWKESARKENAQGQFRYAIYYLLGQFVNQDFDEAVRWLQRAAEQGHKDAIWILGKCYFYGLGVAEDKKQAFQFYKNAAAYGSTGAARDAANCLMEGIGTERDVKEAYFYLQRAAQLGDPLAIQLMNTVSLHDDGIHLIFFDDNQKQEKALHKWLELSYHFEPNTQNPEDGLQRLMHIFGKLPSYRTQERILDLLDKFQNIPGKMHCIEHVNNALYRHLTLPIHRTLEVREFKGRECGYEVVFNGDKVLNDKAKGCNAKGLILYVIVAAFTKRFGHFEKSYADKSKICCNLWKLINSKDRYANESVIEQRVQSYLMSTNVKNKDNKYLSIHLNRNKPLIEDLLGPMSKDFIVKIEGGNYTSSYYSIPADTEIILPQEIKDIFDSPDKVIELPTSHVE